MNNTLKYQHLNLLFQSVLMLVVLNCVYLYFTRYSFNLGDNFMRSVYAVFDLEDHVISIAQAAYNDNHAVVPIE